MTPEKEAIIKSLKKYFQITELVCPDVYKKFNERAWQFFTTDALYGLLLLRETILCRPMYLNNYKKGITQRGLRCNLCALVKGKATVYLSQHCFDEETEILTDKGWKRYDTIAESDMVYSYNLDSSVIEKKPILSIIRQEYNGPMYRFKNLNVDVCATDQHRMVVRSVGSEYKRVRPDRPISEKWQTYLDSLKAQREWHIETAEYVAGRRREMLCAGKYRSDVECDLPMLKLALATIADGYFIYRNGRVAIGFRFKKERKCDELEALLEQIGSPIAKTLDKHGVWNYYIRSVYAEPVFDIIGEKKDIPLSILGYDASVLRELVYYYAKFDGCFSKRANDKHFTIHTTKVNNAEMLQTMCALSGMRCQIHVVPEHKYNIRGKEGVGKVSYGLTINPETDSTRIDKPHITIDDYSGIVWCVNNENTTLVTRRHGLISIQGNCLGNAWDFTVDGMTAEQARKKIKEKASLFPTQIRLEKGTSWVHIDFLQSYGINDKVYEFTA